MARLIDPHGPCLDVDLATQPAEPEPADAEGLPDPQEPLPARQPVEPEFLPQVEPAEPEDPPLRHRPPT